MKSKYFTLPQVLENLKAKNAEFEEVVKELFSFSYEAYNNVFKIKETKILDSTYKRFAIFSNKNCVAILMLWGINNETAIHDHKNYEGKIKVLKGSLTEIYYKETSDFIEFLGKEVATENMVFSEDFGGIHSIINNESELSVSLHIYRTSQMSLEGVRIFDLETKKVAVLSNNAQSCSWNLKPSAYDKIIVL